MLNCSFYHCSRSPVKLIKAPFFGYKSNQVPLTEEVLVEEIPSGRKKKNTLFLRLYLIISFRFFIARHNVVIKMRKKNLILITNTTSGPRGPTSGIGDKQNSCTRTSGCDSSGTWPSRRPWSSPSQRWAPSACPGWKTACCPDPAIRNVCSQQ